jgi:DNA/RNA-binding domain of Phe-tRNA-synthetase-like protein
MNTLEDFDLQLDDAIADAGVVVGFLLLGGIDNRFCAPGFEALRERLWRSILASAAATVLEDDPTLAGYRELHRRFGIDDASLVPSPESLLRLLFKRGELRSINPIVDVYNTVALERRLSCGAHDLDRLDGRLRLAHTRGGERFRALGKADDEPVAAGEYAYLDGAGRVVCRLECRQADHSAVSPATRNVALIVQGHAQTPIRAIDDALTAIESRIRRFLGAPRAARRVLLPEARTGMHPAAVVGEVIA